VAYGADSQQRNRFVYQLAMPKAANARATVGNDNTIATSRSAAFLDWMPSSSVGAPVTDPIIDNGCRGGAAAGHAVRPRRIDWRMIVVRLAADFGTSLIVSKRKALLARARPVDVARTMPSSSY
jgi:hypothetical protein